MLNWWKKQDPLIKDYVKFKIIARSLIWFLVIVFLLSLVWL